MNTTIQSPSTVTIARRQLLAWGAGVALATSLLTSALGSLTTDMWSDESTLATPAVENSEWVEGIMAMTPAEIHAAFSREPVTTTTTPAVEYSEWVEGIMAMTPAEIHAAFSREPVDTSRTARWDGRTGSTWNWSGGR